MFQSLIASIKYTNINNNINKNNIMNATNTYMYMYNM